MGQPVPQEDPGDPIEVARILMLRRLTASPQTRSQLEAYVVKRGVPPEAAAVVLDRFTDVGLIDDAAFAQAWVRSRHSSRGLSGRALRTELVQRGVERDDIDAAVGELTTEQEYATALRLAERKAVSTRGLAYDARVRRLMGMLARKGYGPGTCRAAVMAALAADSESHRDAADGHLGAGGLDAESSLHAAGDFDVD